jgi:hypothetical protein
MLENKLIKNFASDCRFWPRLNPYGDRTNEWFGLSVDALTSGAMACAPDSTFFSTEKSLIQQASNGTNWHICINFAETTSGERKRVQVFLDSTFGH